MENLNTIAGYDQADLDAAWSDEDGFGTADEAQVPEADQPVGEQQPADRPAATETTTDPVEQEGTQQADQPELFTIRYRGQEEQLTREQLITMAQKGRDYDTVRSERDSLRAQAQANAAAVDLVQGYAQRMGMDVPAYLDWVRKQDLMRGGLNEQQAAQTLHMEKRQADLDAREARLNIQRMQQDSLLQQTKARREARQKDLETFLATYPQVKTAEIPGEVWEQVSRGVPMVAAYTMHENARLKAENAALQQNESNKLKTPGGLGANSGAEMDEIDRCWADD